MNSVQGLFPIIKISQLAEELYDLYVRCPSIANEAQPGQFVLIRVESLPLRRPIAVCETDPDNGIVRLVFGIRGEGTKKLARFHEDSWVDLMGPLGVGFRLFSGQKALLVGGGLGVAPLLAAAKFYGRNARAVLGFQKSSQVALVNDFNQHEVTAKVMTEDGGQGSQGVVSEGLEQLLAQQRPDILYACGPVAMLKKAASVAARETIPCQVLMEEKMGCGVGACHVCVCKTKQPDGSVIPSRACSDGPVFDAERVVF